jgi:hypothetical protein
MKNEKPLFKVVAQDEAAKIIEYVNLRKELESLLWGMQIGEAHKTHLPLKIIAPKVYNFGKAKLRRFRVETKAGEVYIIRLA